jgi:hypothetical protein
MFLKLGAGRRFLPASGCLGWFSVENDARGNLVLQAKPVTVRALVQNSNCQNAEETRHMLDAYCSRTVVAQGIELPP